MPVCSALDGLSRAEREKEGKKTEVTKLSFVAAFVAEEGISLEMAVGGRPESWIITPEGWVLRDGFPGMLYHDVPEAEAKIWLARPSRMLSARFAIILDLQHGEKSRRRISSMKTIELSLFRLRME